MSRARQRAALKGRASVFAALGDETRLSLVAKLANGAPQSISALAYGSALTRQGISKHLRVLQDAGLVQASRIGRESRFELTPEPLREVRAYLDQVSDHWERALARLKTLVEA